jgi:hypothetical protein
MPLVSILGDGVVEHLAHQGVRGTKQHTLPTSS